MKSTFTFLRICFLSSLFLIIGFISNAQTPPSGLNGDALKTWLKQNYYDGKHNQLGYTSARRYMYNYIDNHNNKITGVYSGYEVSWTYGGTGTNPSPINCEHTVPQSFFGEAEPMKSDIHHLFPTYQNWNSTRSNHPFAEIDDNTTAKWMYLDQSQTTIPSSNIDLYSEYANSEFEPREDHKGNCARAIFYFYTMYPTQAGNISAVADINELYQWHLNDPVDSDEISRNNAIETYQGDRNPYIDYPDAVANAWGFSTSPSVPSAPAISLTSASSDLTLSWNDVSDETGYKVYRSTGGSYSLVSTLSANATSYVDNSVSTGTTYYYYLIAYNTEGNSANSNTVSGQPGGGTGGNGISVSEALALSTGTAVIVDGVIKQSFNGIYALELQDINGTDVIIVKLETSQRNDWSPDLNPGVVGKSIEVVGVRDTYSSQPSIENVSSITEIGGGTDTEAPTAPSSLAASSVSQTSLSLSWNAASDNVGVTAYDVYRNSTMIGSTSGTSYNVSGLTAATSYTFYIKAKDAAGNVSSASSTINEITLPDAISCTGGISSFPYTESFENTLGAWTQSSDDNLNWTIDANGTPSSSTGPSSATDGSYYLYIESSTSGTGYPTKKAVLNSPCIDLTSESNATFNFAYHMYGSNMGSLDLEISTNGTSWTSVWSKSGDQGNLWYNASVDLAGYTGGIIYARFVGITGSSYRSDITIDKVEITNGGTTTPPTGCTTVSLTLVFDNYPEETSWSITDDSGSTVASGGTYGSEADGSTKIETACLLAGCYTFIINDAYGDGICCSYGNGSYSLVDGGTVLASGSSFSSSQSTNFCVGTSRQQAVEKVNANLISGVSIYPNPVNDYLHIEVINGTPEAIEVYNIHGSKVALEIENNVVNVSTLKAGMYIVAVKRNGGTIMERFTKE